MSRTEVERLKADLAADHGLGMEFHSLPPEIDERVAWAAQRGYSVSAGELSELSAGELSDDDLEMVAGGWDDTSGGGGGGGG